MRRRFPVATHHVHRSRRALFGLAGATAGLQAAAALGLAYVAGFSKVGRALSGAQWYWLVVMTAALAVSFVGYHFACRGVYEVRGGPRLAGAQMLSVSIAGFGGFLAHGGAGLDKFALNAAGADEWQADSRVSALAALEHGVLGLLGMIGGIAVLIRGYRIPSLGFSLPWAILPLPGFVVGFWLAGRYERRLDGTRGRWPRRLSVLVECAVIVRHLFAGAFRRPPAVWGMVLFWVAEMFSVWSALAAFGVHMNLNRLVIAVGTGMVFTRRTGPLSGAGVILLTLTASLYYCGAPLAPAVAGATAYRVVSVWLPIPFSVAQLPRLRTLGIGPLVATAASPSAPPAGSVSPRRVG